MTTSNFIARPGQSELFGHPITMPALAPNPAVETLARIALTLLPVAGLAALFSGL